MYDVVIVGAGISGLTLAERYANDGGRRVLVLEKRGHIGGNCYDYVNEIGVLAPLYGPHYFHTNSDSVWQYVSRFTDWHPYEHRVLSVVDGLEVPIPINRTTINRLFGLDLKLESEVEKWLEAQRIKFDEPANSEEMTLSLVGPVLYEKMFKHYTKKQWDMWPAELDASVTRRIPVRSNDDDRYFTDQHQGMPKNGYTAIFERMADNPLIEIKLNTDYLLDKPSVGPETKIFFTGPIDRYFGEKHDRLQYRSIRFEIEHHNVAQRQSRAQINYPGPEVPFTRITEPKLATGQKTPRTTTIREYSTWEGEPYYPVPNPQNHEVFARYQTEADKLANVYFVGRLANYKYFNMDQAFLNALDVYNSLEHRQ